MKANKSKISARSVSRLYAVLAVFQCTVSHSDEKSVVEDFLSDRDALMPKIDDVPIKSMDINFFKELVQTCVQNLDAIMSDISGHLSNNWTAERLDPVLLCVLQLGVCEILFFQTIPSKVILNEYTEIAKAFFLKTNVAFINGVLNNIAREKRPDDVFND